MADLRPVEVMEAEPSPFCNCDGEYREGSQYNIWYCTHDWLRFYILK